MGARQDFLEKFFSTLKIEVILILPKDNDLVFALKMLPLNSDACICNTGLW
jgi:hypothetical protein